MLLTRETVSQDSGVGNSLSAILEALDEEVLPGIDPNRVLRCGRDY